MKREIITIDEEKCNGCGLCIPNCDEQAIEISDGKARLIDESMCDGLGVCMDSCPEKALTLAEREAEPFDERKSLEKLVQKESIFMEDYLQKLSVGGDTEMHKEYGNMLKLIKDEGAVSVYPDSAPVAWEKNISTTANHLHEDVRKSELMHWPVQLHLINPAADFLSGKDVVLAADCVAYALADFHSRFLKGRGLAIACPRLDRDTELYSEYIRLMADEARINTLTVVIMQVSCCLQLKRLAQEALQKAARKVPLKAIVISTQGEVLSEEWV